ncbi:MAG TPA: proline dehydrogenase family protein [Gaiellaceae bacterium]|jgi:proline dehydrogenase|nr:proline dehydrogenase family protein [Gaiellaceae bacterium]
MAIFDRAIVRTLPVVPKGIVRRISSRYIAGTRVEDACRVVELLNAEGKLATIDVLGEEITTWEEARHIGYEYENVFRAIEEQGLDSNVSVKLTALGLKLDYGLCREIMERLVRSAGERGNFVRIDMEDSSCTDDTLRLYRELRGRGLDNLGVVLQGYLRRTPSDIEALSDLTPNVRLCKGIYLEPEEIAFHGYEEVRENFVRSLDALLSGGSYVGVATHDEWLIGEGERLARERGLSREQYEFQMLLGVRAERATSLVAAGHRVRIYVPYGEHWYAYSLRRLQENPKLAGYIAADTLGRLLPGRNGR